MTAAAVQPPVGTGAVRRRAPRHRVAVPVDVIVLRSGIPDGIPGRSLDVGEGGMAAILAGELRPGDSVGVEFRLPYLNLPLRAKAVVRHHAWLRCGLEFLGLSLEQQAMIRYWARRSAEIEAAAVREIEPVAAPEPPQTESSSQSSEREPQRTALFRRALWAALAAFVLVGGLGWWQWYRAWGQLESSLPGKTSAANLAAAKVPPDVMEQRLTHKVEPVYPDAARRSNAQGVVLLDAVIGRDGTVVELHPVSGPDVLAPAAVEAVKWWRFQPYRVNGQPVEVETMVAVEFRP